MYLHNKIPGFKKFNMNNILIQAQDGTPIQLTLKQRSMYKGVHLTVEFGDTGKRRADTLQVHNQTLKEDLEKGERLTTPINDASFGL